MWRRLKYRSVIDRAVVGDIPILTTAVIRCWSRHFLNGGSLGGGNKNISIGCYGTNCQNDESRDHKDRRSHISHYPLMAFRQALPDHLEQPSKELTHFRDAQSCSPGILSLVLGLSKVISPNFWSRTTLTPRHHQFDGRPPFRSYPD